MRPLLLCLCVAAGACARQEAPAPVVACFSQERMVTIDGIRQSGLATVCRNRESGLAMRD